MKKVLFTAIAVLGFTFANAQSRDKGAIELTPIIGYSSYFLNGDEVNGLSSLTSVNFGVDADYYFNDRWSLRSGLHSQTMGAKDSYSKLKLNYLNVPVNANWHFGSTRKWNLNFGVTPGFLTSAKIDGEDVKDQVSSFQMGISYGIGYKLEINENFSLLLDTQGFFGLSNIIKDGNVTRMNAGSGFNIGGVFKL
jgi:long-subunit fatty acid transport protein